MLNHRNLTVGVLCDYITEDADGFLYVCPVEVHQREALKVEVKLKTSLQCMNIMVDSCQGINAPVVLVTYQQCDLVVCCSLNG